MSGAKWTPSPWSKDAIYWLLRFGRKQSGPWDEHGEENEFFPDEDDASLISAAPDLYTALANIRGYSDSIHPSDWCAAEAAMAKARGEL